MTAPERPMTMSPMPERSEFHNRWALAAQLPAPMLLPAKLKEDLDGKEKAELIKLIGDLAFDFQLLNQIYNDRAVGHGWCSNYEAYQSRYNEHFRLMRLQGRTHLVGSWLNRARSAVVGATNSLL